jgi:hypothetical protein
MFYTLSVSRLLPLLGVRHDEQTGAMLLASVRHGRSNWSTSSSLVGLYMLHGCLQVFASELSVEARATAL